MALALGTIVITVSYFAYGTATSIPGDMDGQLIFFALLLAPVAFLLITHLSGAPEAWKRGLQAVGILVLVALPIGLLAPILGASAGYGAGVIFTLNRPPFASVVRNRVVAVTLTLAYTLLLLVTITPAGVMAGALLPPLMVGFADEFSAWKAAR